MKQNANTQSLNKKINKYHLLIILANQLVIVQKERINLERRYKINSIEIFAFWHVMLGHSQDIIALVNPVLPSQVDSKVDIIHFIADLVAHALLFSSFCGCRGTTGLRFWGFQSPDCHAIMFGQYGPK